MEFVFHQHYLVKFAIVTIYPNSQVVMLPTPRVKDLVFDSPIDASNYVVPYRHAH